MEDDIALTSNFCALLPPLLRAWHERHYPAAQMLALGYLHTPPGYFDAAQRDGALAVGIDSGNLWGLQAYALRVPEAAFLSRLLHHDRLSKVRDAIDPFGAASPPPRASGKGLVLQSDALMDVFLRRAAVVPPMAFEAGFRSTYLASSAAAANSALQDASAWGDGLRSCGWDPSTFYRPPPPKLPL